MNLAAWVERNGLRLSVEPALAHGDQVHADWATFAARVASGAGGLSQRLDLAPSDRVAIVMSNRPEYIEALFAIWHAGLVAVPVNARLHREEIAYILESSRSSVVITDDEHQADCQALTSTVSSVEAVVTAPGASWDELLSAEPVPLFDRGPDDPAWLFYTSGTTGRPKAATLTHRNLMVMSLSYFADIDTVSSTDSVLHAAPISHGSGMYGLPGKARPRLRLPR